MKKELKIFLSVFVIILVAAGSYLLYTFKFKEYDVADEEVEQIVKNPYEIELPDGTKLTLGEDGEVVDSGQVDAKTAGSVDGGNAPATDGTDDSSKEDKLAVTGKHTSSNPNSGSTGTANRALARPENSKPAEPVQKPTVASIKQKYAPTFGALQSQADGKLNALVGRAKSEYSTKKANGESIDFGYFYNKYAGAANGLEAQTDAVFNGVISAVEKDLTANGFDKSYAQSFIDEYNAKKKARRDNLLSKAMGQ